MDKTRVHNTIRTDLSLLLECLKFQMKAPDLQKQALLTIHSICEKRDDHVDLFREMGGVAFVHNLSKSSIVHSNVRETALFTLGTLAEANVFCKNSLCKMETFSDLAGWMVKDDAPLTLKRVSVYLLCVLVTDNRSGQTLAQTSGCLDILLELFKTTFPLSYEATAIVDNGPHACQLWASVCSALCGCVNNPQNEEGQHHCVAAFPIINVWLQHIALTRTEILKSVCSVVAMTVANNCYAQESFSASGGLETLTRSLLRLTSVEDMSLVSCQLSVIISKTLSACVSENAALASGLAEYDVVSRLFTLLSSPHLDPEDRLSVLVTVGHCTEASEEHQSQLVQCGGLPLIITLLTDVSCEEVRKAATFILQMCKQATGSFVHGVDKTEESLVNIDSFSKTARELLCRINQLEKKQAQGADDEQGAREPQTSTEGLCLQSLRPDPPPQHENMNIAAYRQSSIQKHMAERSSKCQSFMNVALREDANKLRSSFHQEKVETGRGGEPCPMCKRGRAAPSSHQRPLEGDRELSTTESQWFKRLAPMRHSAAMQIIKRKEALHSSSNKREVPAEEPSPHHNRCAGCVLPFAKVTSRNFASLQSSCGHSCDIHTALQAATERFRARQRRLTSDREHQGDRERQTFLKPQRVSAAQPHRRHSGGKKPVRNVSMTPLRKGAREEEPQRNKQHGISLTPLHRGAKKGTTTSHNAAGMSAILSNLLRSSYTVSRRKRATSSPAEGRGGNIPGRRVPDDEEAKTHADLCSSRRKRQDFSAEEVCYLLRGVNTLGTSWNSILWSYPFQPGRTNVDLAKKYRRLMKEKSLDDGADHGGQQL